MNPPILHLQYAKTSLRVAVAPLLRGLEAKRRAVLRSLLVKLGGFFPAGDSA